MYFIFYKLLNFNKKNRIVTNTGPWNHINSDDMVYLVFKKLLCIIPDPKIYGFISFFYRSLNDV
jgi:hypothetical protein